MSTPEEWKAKLDRALFERWYIVPNDVVGGWSIAMVDQPMSEIVGREPVLVDDVTSFEVAAYIVGLHHYRLGIR